MRSTLLLRLALATALIVAVPLLHPDGALIFLGPPVVALLPGNVPVPRRAIAFAVGFVMAFLTPLCLTGALALFVDLSVAWQTARALLISIANVFIPAYVTYECLPTRRRASGSLTS
ncbi:MAG TPA: hypothetical protein VM639_12925 [Dongiaceae bacterium]|nr:hypothetical protein [Dongiaceae bacterium]